MNKIIQKNEVSLSSPKSLMVFADQLKHFIVNQKLYTNIQGKNYVNVEGWQFAGGNLGLLPVVESCERLEREKEVAYKASVALYSGERIVARGIAVCSTKERGKENKDEFVIASMSQTRAEGKAYRLILGWLMKVAGYEGTPSEEMDEEPSKEARTIRDEVANGKPVKMTPDEYMNLPEADKREIHEGVKANGRRRYHEQKAERSMVTDEEIPIHNEDENMQQHLASIARE